MQTRIHKYKAWHITAKLMLYGTPKEVFQWVEDGQPVIPLQFTGLHDKIGKPIYEGDIVKSQRENSGLGWQGDIYQVIFDSKYCMFCMTCIKSDNPNRVGNLAATSGGHPYIIVPKKTEIIGNIYEHKNLFK